METLVLDSGYRPVEVISWRTAITKVVIDKTVRVIEAYPDRYIRTVNPLEAVGLNPLPFEHDGETRWMAQMPSVVALIRPVNRRRAVKFSRHNVFIRDNNTCQYCAHKFHRSQINLDHVIPRAKGGRTTWDNVVCSCIPCNNKKGMKLAHEVGMQLIRPPVKPKKLSDSTPYMQYRKGMPIEWQSYLRNAIYWDAELESDESK